MKTRSFLLLAAITACASTEELLDGNAAPPETPVPPTDAGTPDAPPAEEDAGPCDDCEYFPEVCTADVFCPNGPFAAGTVGGSLDDRTQINVIRGRSTSDVWIAGALGAIAHFDGTSWRRSDLGARETVLGLWLRESSEIAVGVPDLYASVQRVYVRDTSAPDAGVPVSADGWAVFETSLPPTTYNVDIVSAWAAPGAGSLWLALDTRIDDTTSSGLFRLRQSGSTTFEIGLGPGSACWPGCNRISALHGTSADDVWAVGSKGVTIRITAAESDTPNATLYDSRTWNMLNGVWAASASEAWSVGAVGTIRHYVGAAREWDVVHDVPTTANLNAVAGSSPSDVWAVGDAGVVLHYDGKAWSRMKVAGLGDRRPKLTAVWVAAPGHVWIGGKGVVLSLGGKP